MLEDLMLHGPIAKRNRPCRSASSPARPVAATGARIFDPQHANDTGVAEGSHPPAHRGRRTSGAHPASRGPISFAPPQRDNAVPSGDHPVYESEADTFFKVPLTNQDCRYKIREDTSIDPRDVAHNVLCEAVGWLRVELPREWELRLSVRADTIYSHNPRFRRQIRRGASGRDWLWSFMRHWLSAMIGYHDPQLHARLPSDYSRGRELPKSGG